MPNASQAKHSFTFLNLTQFLGALNDNLFKLLLIFFLIGQSGSDRAAAVASLAGAVFVVPFLLFSPVAGILADRLSKSRLIVFAKLLEAAVMVLGAWSFWRGSEAGLYVALFLMALQSTFFSPAKYGILPEIVGRDQLSRANGQVEALTYLAIILGTALAAFLPQWSGQHYALAALATVLIAAVGVLTSLGIERTASLPPTEAVKASALAGFRGSLATLRHDGYLTLAVIGAAVFMLMGAFVQLNLIPFGIQELGLNQEQSGALFLLVAFGIGGGSLLAGRLSGRNVELGIVPLGAVILAAAALLAGTASSQAALALPALFLLGVGGGLFIVPLQAFIQFRAPDAERGKILAITNFLSWSGILLAAGLTHLLGVTWGARPGIGFLLLGGLAVILTLVTLRVLPDFLLRFFALVVMRLAYRVRVAGAEQVPTEGGALLVANHVSWIDALLLTATQQRRIRFLMERSIYQHRLLNPVFRLMRVIPISARDGRREIAASLGEARQALEEGWLVCIFAEGQITRNGTLQEFRPGFETIVGGTEHPIIPVHIGGVWGRLFSYGRRSEAFGRQQPVRISFGEPLAANTGAAEVRQAVMELSCDDFNQRKTRFRTLGRRLVRSARSHWRQPALADTTGTSLSFGRSLTAALALKRVLQPRLGERPMTGLLLPPSTGAALANLALTLAGRVPVNLNYTASREAFASALRQAEIDTVITSRRVLSRVDDLPLPEKVLFLEDLIAELTPRAKLTAWLAARLLPAAWLLRQTSADADAPATVIFSSGSTGEPKGVLLSHHNIISNIEALDMVFSVDRRDKLCGVLPLFHSFGYTGTLWLPLLAGFSVVYHPNPLEPAKIAAIVREHRCSFLLSTPTFLQSYLRRAQPEDFASLRVVVTGAEKLSPNLAVEFADKFGVMPLEGYGATELSPVAALNLPDVRLGGVEQAGSLPGSAGRPLPGIAVCIADPETLIPQAPDQEGMILVKGPNLMQGYLGQPGRTAEALRDGWYVTGDIGRFDRKGFLHITGRLARFSKIAGEMVPHGVVEEALLTGLQCSDPAVAVTAVPDPRKGERLVVVHTPQAGGARKLLALLEDCGLPNLWKPATGDFLEIDRLPLLGSGKLDLQRLKALACERLGVAAANR